MKDTLTNQQLRDTLKANGLRQCDVYKPLNLCKQTFNAWVKDRHKISNVWSRLLIQHFEENNIDLIK